MNYYDVTIDMLVGPTYLHGGLSYGNIASVVNRSKISHPKKAALQGLEKMKCLHDLGLSQLVFPPYPRPDYGFLQMLGFSGSKKQILEKAYQTNRQHLYQATSSAMMWMANAATITPSQDSHDNKVHITIANLASHAHRGLEAYDSYKLFKHVFSDEDFFTVHPPLPSFYEYFDEGAANHTRFYLPKTKQGIHLFVWGRSMRHHDGAKRFPARQTLEAQEAITRLHRLDQNLVLFCQQNPKAIDSGVFHNDVIATGHNDLFFVHEEAFVNTAEVINALKKKGPIQVCCIPKKMLSLSEAVATYLFNSQIVCRDGATVLIASQEVKKSSGCQKALEKLKSFGIDDVIYLNLSESMKNGGGAACLRLRLVVNDQEWQKIRPTVIFTDSLYFELTECVERCYPENLRIQELCDPKMQKKIADAYTAIYKIFQTDKLFMGVNV